MGNRKKIIGVVFISILILAIGMTLGENDPKIRTQFEVVEKEKEKAQLRCYIDGVKEGHVVNLYNPNDEKVDTVNVTSDNFADHSIGIVRAMVDVSMADESNPIAGNYRFVIDDPSSEDSIYEEVISFDGPDIEIADMEFETESTDDGWEITGIKVKVNNDGDLPIYADEMNLTVGDESENISFYEELMSGETTELDENVNLGVEAGTHSVSLALYSYGEVFDTYETDVAMGE